MMSWFVAIDQDFFHETHEAYVGKGDYGDYRTCKRFVM